MRNKISAVFFIIFILFFACGFWLVDDREFSEMENRNLSTLPSFTVKSLLDGDYTAAFEEYMADQMVLKDTFVSLRVDMARQAGQKLINGVFFGEDGYLISQYSKPDDQLANNIDEIVTFAKRVSIPVTMLIAPNVSEIYPENLPFLASCYSQSEVISEIEAKLGSELQFVDATDILLSHKNEELYFKTDHHWNMKGAYYGYQALCEALGVTSCPLQSYVETVYSTDFYGSLYSKAPSVFQVPDTLTLYENPAGEYLVTYVQEGVTSGDVYKKDNLDIKDKYTVFLDGNHPYITIESNAKQKEHVLVIKDSYAHALLPFLADTYANLYIIDLRYYHDSIDTLIEENEIDEVIMIHNVDFISSDVNFIWLN